jgi:hypothetical protein
MGHRYSDSLPIPILGFDCLVGPKDNPFRDYLGAAAYLNKVKAVVKIHGRPIPYF